MTWKTLFPFTEIEIPKKPQSFISFAGYRRRSKKTLINLQIPVNRFERLSRFGQKSSSSIPSRSVSKEESEKRLLHICFLRRKRARKRNTRSYDGGERSFGTRQCLPEEGKAGFEDTNQNKKKARRGSEKQGKSGVLLSEQGRSIRQSVNPRLRAKSTIEVDWASGLSYFGFPLLQENKEEGDNDVLCRDWEDGWKLIGLDVCDSVLRWKRGGVSEVKGRRREYGGLGVLVGARKCASVGLSSNFRMGQVIIFLIAYLNALVDVLENHNHPIFSLCVKTLCLYVCFSLSFNFLGWFRFLFLFSNSIYVAEMEKEIAKMACDLEMPISNNMAISSSSNHSGINTQGPKISGKSKKTECEIPVESSSVLKGNNTSQVESLDVQLDKIRLESFEVKKSNSLMGYVCGNTSEFRKIKIKLLSIWRLMRGEVQIYERGHGWFEYIFRNASLLNRIWNGRPYHVLGHLLLLRPWRMDFSTKLENTNVLDLWIRIFHLPSTLACHNGVKLILEENGLGKFIKFDRASGGFFARACVNIDVAKHVPGDVRISDNEDHPLLLVWFEDFPHGCGNCGELAHEFKSCPLGKFTPKKISITIVRKDSTTNVAPPSNVIEEEEEEGWVLVSKDKKKRAQLAVVGEGAQVVKGQVKVVQGGVLDRAIEGGIEGVVVQPERELGGGEVYSSPVDEFKENNKEEGELIEGSLKEADMLEDDHAAEPMFIAQLEKGLAGPSNEEILSIMPPPFINEEPNKTNSDSFKRKGGDDTSEDTATSSSKRKKSRGVK